VSAPTVEAARRALAARFKTIESAELDARLLLGHALGLDLTGLISAAQRRLTQDESARLEEFAGRRLTGEPVARIIGEKEFWGLPLRLSPATLVPRPDTETVVELALEIFRGLAISGRSPRIADIGVGSGAILLALLHEIPDAFGIGTDLSLTALITARDNARALGLAGRAGFVACSYASALRGPFDLIVSNPPYIRSGDIADLAVEVRDVLGGGPAGGGADGLAAFLRAQRVAALVDATHPFAKTISAHAVAACAAAGVPLLRLERPGWAPGPGDDWHPVATMAAAAQALGAAPRRIFLTIGRQDLIPFRDLAPQHDYLIRSVDAPEAALLPPQARLITARGPFAEAAEQALLAETGIDILVTKNSGGSEAKLAAARSLGLPVIMVERPPVSGGDRAETAEAALAWILDHGVRTMRGA